MAWIISFLALSSIVVLTFWMHISRKKVRSYTPPAKKEKKPWVKLDDMTYKGKLVKDLPIEELQKAFEVLANTKR
jgi:hypothetical protein